MPRGLALASIAHASNFCTIEKAKAELAADYSGKPCMPMLLLQTLDVVIEKGVGSCYDVQNVHLMGP